MIEESNLNSGLYETQYNPDILMCLANLSNDEVFTPPEIANQMLDLLPQEIFKDPNVKFLDPACKSGVFLREIAKRLIEGEKDIYPNLQKRIDHIMHEQLYAIAITELTSLLARRSVYCSKYPNGKFSISHFDTPEGNIRYKRIEHTWENGKYKYCGITEDSKMGVNRSEDLESHAYEFIHTISPEEIFNMKFDVICGNPPYQMTVGTQSEKYAIPLYNKFIEQAKKLNPRYLTMIVPAKWYTGGRGLDDFRKSMLSDKHLTKMVDFPNPYDCFQGVDNTGGICYFLWERDAEKLCEFTTKVGDKKTTITRDLNEYDFFIRDATGLSIIKKVSAQKINAGKVLSNVVSPQTPFGIITSYKPTEKGVPCWYKQRVGLKFVHSKDVKDIYGYIGKWKVLIPEAPIAGQTDFTKSILLYYEGNTVVAKPEEICTQTYLVANSFSTKQEADNFRSYLLTKVVRFLVLQTVISQHVSREKFCFVPDLGKYDRIYTDEYLCKEWNITDEEWAYIYSKIRNFGDSVDGSDETVSGGDE